MTDLNTDITHLSAAVAAESANPLFIFAEALTGIQARFTAEQLTAEELTIAEPTVERIAIAEQIRDYMYRAVGVYRGLGHRDTPTFLLQDQTDTADFTELMAALPAGTGLVAAMIALGNPDLAQLQALHARWTELVAAEQLAEGARAKVQQLIDIRALLVGMLRYLGRSGSQIQALMVG